MVLPAKATVIQSGELPATDGMAVAVLFSRDFSPETSTHLGDEIVQCVVRALTRTAPNVHVESEEEFDRTLFGLKPGEVLLRRDTLDILLARPDVKRRATQSGLTHVVLVEGATRHRAGASPGVVAIPYVWLGTWSETKRHTEFRATIIEVAGAGTVQVNASAEGRQGLVVGAPLPGAVGWVQATEFASCEALGDGMARALRGSSQ